MNKTAIIGSIIFCASCSVGPNYHEPQIYSNQAINQAIGINENPNLLVDHHWYRTFGDAQLDRLVEYGLKKSPDAKNAQEKLRQARLNLQITRADYAPSINAKGEYLQAKSFQTPEYKSKSDYYTIGFDAAWEIDIWGKTRRAAESAQAMLQAAGNNYENVQISLRAEIAKTYVDYRMNEKLLEITKENYRLQSEILEIVKSKHKAGIADDLALEQAKAAQLNSQIQIPDLTTAVEKYKNNLSLLTGLLSSQLNLHKSDLLEKNPQITTDNLGALPADVVRNRPDVRYYERILAAQNALVGSKTAELFPNLSLSALLGWQNNTLSPIFAGEYEVYSLGGNLAMPLLNWGKLRNNIKLQESATMEAYNNYQTAILTATADISNAIKNVREKQKRLQTAQAKRQTNSNILDLSLIKYKNGLTDFSDVLYAQENKLSADQEYCQTLAGLYTGIAGFYKAIGF